MDYQTIESMIQKQKTFFSTHATIPVPFRKRMLQNLRKVIKKYEPQIQEALFEDLGKSSKDAYMLEIGPVYSEISYMLRHLNSLAATHYTWTPLHQFPGLSMSVAVPYGNVLIMSPWNYPFLLTIQPLVDALAAGNTAILKPSDYSKNVSDVIDQMIAEVFPPEYVACVKGGREENQALLDCKFDYIFFTGSPAVGKLAMEKASVHLTPITLELGGKSPVIVDESANLAMAAKRIVWGKLINAGQTCVAPDYLCVHESVKDELIQLICHEISKQCPDPSMIGKIINEKHYERLLNLMSSGTIVCGGLASANTLQIAPTVLDHVSWDSAIMQEEIFGPILPVITYTDFNDLVSKIASRPTPLAFYLFTRMKERKDQYKKVFPFGGGCINDTIVQLANDHLPFGGMGNSGMGQYHGKYGFQTFSHTKGILDKPTGIDLPMRYANAPSFWTPIIKFFLK